VSTPTSWVDQHQRNVLVKTISSLLLLPAGLLESGRIYTTKCHPKGSSASIVFTHGPIFGFFATTRFTDQGEIWHHSSLPNFTLVGSGEWVYGPNTLKIRNFTNIIAPKGRVLCTILTKFTRFMRVLSLHNSAKYGCFSLINDKIINNLPRWGRFQPNFRWPLAAKLIDGTQKSLGWNDDTDHLYHRAKFGGNRTTHVGVRGWSVMFFSLCFLKERCRPSTASVRCWVTSTRHSVGICRPV